MYLACSSESYGQDLDSGRLTLADWLRLCATDLGLRAVEIEDRHIGVPSLERLTEVRSEAERYGLEIVSIAFMNNFGLADAEARHEEQRRTTTWMTVSRELGARYLRTFAGWPEGERAARWPDMIAALQATAADAHRHGVRLVLENHNHDGFVRTAADVERIFGAVDSPALGLLLDTGNYVDGVASIERTARLAWHVHAKFTNVRPDGRDARHDHDAVLRILRAGSYSGCISVEYEGAEPGSTAVPRILEYLRHAIVG
jgi:L-ribulose-5-phosphate 3-epimerase